MHDRVADVLAQRVTLDRGGAPAFALSILLHGGLIALAVWSAFHAKPAKPVQMVEIRFANFPRTVASAPAAPAARPATRPSTPAAQPPPLREPEPKILEPRPQPVNTTTAPPEKNTVPLSPFGRSTRKGSENPAAGKPPEPAPSAAPGIGTAADVPIGGTGVTGLEGGDFPYTLYVEGMQRRIGSNWFRPQVTAGASTVVYFRIQRNGTITDARVVTPSGNSTFDRAALSAVRSSNPLTQLPPGYNGTYLGVHLTFR